MIEKRVLVTGGAGFLGSHLCRLLLEEGNEVICLDNFCTGSRENIAPLMDESAFELIAQDVCFPINVEVDEIYNLACPASPVHYQIDPVQTMKSSVLGSLNVLVLAQSAGAKVFQASTSEVYGDPEVHPQVETYTGSVNTIGPRACYDEGKRCAETLFFDYKRKHDTEIRVARIFNTYGPNMHPQDGRVVSTFIIQALKNEPLTLFGDGTQTRSFCYVDDLIDGFNLLMKSNTEFASPINLGNPFEFSVEELANEIIELTNSRSSLTFLPLPADDPRQRRPDISLASEALGWSPKVQLTEGLEKTIEYFAKVV